MLDLTIQIWVRGGLKLLLECYKTSFDNINFLKWKKAAPANRVAFLALTTLKVKNMEIMQYKTPKKPKNVKKFWNSVKELIK